RKQLDVARFAVFTSTLCDITMNLQLTVDKDEFSIFIVEEGMSPNDRARAISSDCKGSSDELSEASFSSYASIIVVPKSVGEVISAERPLIVASPLEPNIKAHNSSLRINISANKAQNKPIRYDGLESKKFEFHMQFRGGMCRKVGGENLRDTSSEVDN
ncbi:hypothetical protein Ancab_016232, partial [Ancistrocladus abbreviatus]